MSDALEFEEDDDLIERLDMVVDGKQLPERIDKFVVRRIENMTRNKVQNAASFGGLIVNGKSVKSNYKIRPLDRIQLYLPKSNHPSTLIPENIPLDILHEDEDVIVLRKPAGLVVHPGVGNFTGTLAHGLAYHMDSIPTKSDLQRPGIVHRLDKNTSGLMVVAKTDHALQHLAKQFFDHSIKRRYVAIVWGDLSESEGTVNVHIGRDQRHRKLFTIYPDGDHGKHAITHYSVLERLGYINVVECRLETGRTHQIRVHMKSLGHPIFNDDFYGGDKIVKGTVYTKYKQFVENCFGVVTRQALHAKVLGFVHPRTGEELYFEDQLPTEFEQLLDKWRRFMKARNDTE